MKSREERMLLAQQQAMRAFNDALGPLIDGKVVVGCEVVVLMSIDGHHGASRCNMGHTNEAKQAVRQAAMQIALGLSGDPISREDMAYTRPKRH